VIQRVAVVGVGAIGASWAALFAARGLDVVASDPRSDAADELRATVHRVWPSLDRLGLVVAGGTPDRIRVVTDPAFACEGAELVQENAPERLEVKHELYQRLDEVCAAEVILASSSSGFTPSELQVACARHPERVIVGHPFNPPHLVPLVEVVGGTATSAEVIARAMAFYDSCGKAPIHIRAELPGHVTNRLQAALWREAYWLVEQGVVSVADIDRAISSGPGLRWSLLGPFATQHFSGGPGGIAHVLEHLGPPMVDWWQTMQTPQWTEELRAAVTSGVADELDGLDQPAVLAARDRLLEQLLIAKAAEQHLPGPPRPPSTPADQEAAP
jgi:carnitine 3-dehydrogenase